MTGDDDEAGPGFFSLRSVHPSEIGDDGSYVFVDPDNDSQTGSERLGGSASTQRHRKTPQRVATTIWAWALSSIFTTALLLLPFATVALFVPLASFLALPLLIFIAGAIFYTVPSLSYLFLAQTAAPPRASLPFLPAAGNYRLLLRVNLATFRWFQTAITLFITVAPEIAKTRLLYTIGRNWTGRVKMNIRFSPRSGAILDVYLPKPVQSSSLLLQDTPIPSTNLRSESFTFPASAAASTSGNVATDKKAPIIIFIPAPHYGLIRTQKWMVSSLGRNLARMGYCVIIPDIVAFGDVDATSSPNESASVGERRRSSASAFSPSKIRDSVQELRSAMRWAYDNGALYGGDQNKIYLAGHGLGAHLALLHVIQRAVVSSREAVFHSYASASQAGTSLGSLGVSTSGAGSASRPPPVVISNGTRRVHEYGKSVWVPPVEGLILLSPICDVEKQVTKESELGISHLSTVRRALGPGQLPCIMHSPAHILHASRNIIDVNLLPKRVVFFHGGYDRVVHWSQSENMKELLLGVGVEDVKSRIYTTGHTGILTGLMSHERGTLLGAHLEREIQTAIPLTH